MHYLICVVCLNEHFVKAHRFGTEVLVPEDRFAAMFDVRIPTTNASVASVLPKTLMEHYNTWVPVYPILPLG